MRKNNVKAAPPARSARSGARARSFAKPSAKPRPTLRKSVLPSHVVGIGGSAGSLDALERFFRALQPNTAMSFVVVTHRDPSSKGMMVEILSRFTPLKVCEAKHGVPLERGVVYVVPANKHLDVQQGRVALRDRPTDARARTPIDSLFRAIAEDRRERSVGVVLSGMGGDGTVGLAAIKENLGYALVQDPKTAAYDAMPVSAIAAGLADVVGAPEHLAHTLDALAAHAVTADAADETPPSASSDAAAARTIDAVLGVIRARTGHDFSQYKQNTIARRIERRMNLHRVADLSAYVELLERDASEVDLLFADLLIGMTRFFRDPEVFQTLAELGLSDLLHKRPADRPLRVWVAGCASGEEAYSLAILIREQWESEGRKEPLNVQIYATDLDQAAIDRARKGCYGLDIAVDVSKERLARYFTEDAGLYRVKKDIREMVVFATQNLISDPPFTKLDILSCRNVLIYFEPQLQRKLLRLFLYALSPGGLLVLGTSESVGGFEDGFAPLHGDLKIFRRRPSARGLEANVEFPLGALHRGGPRADLRVAKVARRSLLPEVVQRAVVDHVAPPVVVVDKNGDLLFASQRTGRYFEPPAGKGSLNVFAMAREGLALPLRRAVRKSLANDVQVKQRGIRVRTNGHDAIVDLTVSPLRDADYAGTVMIALVETETLRGGASRSRPSAKWKGRKTDQAAIAELQQTQTQLDELIDEMGQAQEALRTANEELQSTNEELQSTNEELTTSKEEMQSMNEELLTLNAELQTTNEALATTNDDMRNLLNSSQIPTLFLDNDLRLKRFTVQASRIAHLIPTDVGRPITDLAWGLRYETLEVDVRQVLDTLVFKEAEVIAEDGSIYTMRIHPYRTLDDVIDGVVITFIDITSQKAAARDRMEAERQRVLVETIGRWAGVAYIEDVKTGRSVVVSKATERILGYPQSMLERADEDFWRTLHDGDKKKGSAKGRNGGKLGRIEGPSGGRRRSAALGGSGVSSRSEVCLRRRDGVVVRYRESVEALVTAADGRSVLVLHTFRRRPLEEGGKANGGRKTKASQSL